MPNTSLGARLSLFDKQRFVLSLSEDEFRDRLVRPLFLRRGMKDGRDTCGPTEEGKDCVFLHVDPLGDTSVYAVQTKRGNLNMARDASRNLVEAITQLRTMLETEISFIKDRTRRRPTKAFLCVSGKINDKARDHIVATVGDPRIEFRDVDDFIPDIDAYLPEFWLGIDTNKSPYLTALLDSLTTEEHVQNGRIDVFTVPVREDTLLQLRVYRLKMHHRRVRGRFYSEDVPTPDFEEFPVEHLSSSSDRRILLTAGAGEGKTTALRRIAAGVAEASLSDLSSAVVPVLLRAQALSGGPTSIVETMSLHTRSISTSGEAGFSLDDLEDGRVTLLVDGLDEVATQVDREAVVDELVSFHEQYPRCRLLVSSRNYRWLDELAQLRTFERYSISPIDWREASRLARKLARGKQLPAEQTAEVLRRLQEVHGLDLTPMLVTVFLASSDAQRYDIPANITEIFKKFTEQMIGRWDDNKGIAHQFEAPLKDFLLTRIAFEMHREQITALSLEQLEGVLRSQLVHYGLSVNTDGLVNELIYRSGLFRVLGTEVEFRHLLLQEFFAGRGMSASDVQAFVSDPWWQRCILFYFGDHAADLDTLQKISMGLHRMPSDSAMQAAMTLGLALQACYLTAVDDRAIVYTEIIEAMGVATEAQTRSGQRSELPHVLGFVADYLVGRDSATCDVLRTAPEAVADSFRSIRSGAAAEFIEYWRIVGLMESGLLEEAYESIRVFNPRDPRTLLSLYLGALLFEKIREASSPQRQVARRISELLAPKIGFLRDVIVKEYQSMLLEMRRGRVAAVPPTVTSD